MNCNSVYKTSHPHPVFAAVAGSHSPYTQSVILHSWRHKLVCLVCNLNARNDPYFVLNYKLRVSTHVIAFIHYLLYLFCVFWLKKWWFVLFSTLLQRKCHLIIHSFTKCLLLFKQSMKYKKYSPLQHFNRDLQRYFLFSGHRSCSMSCISALIWSIVPQWFINHYHPLCAWWWLVSGGK